MQQRNWLSALFTRDRRAGDLVFAVVFFTAAVLLLSQIGQQTHLKDGVKLFAQPRFWPAISLGGMVVFAGFHLLGSVVSLKSPGRWREVGLWLATLEYALWFILYAMAVPVIGYLPSTIVFCLALSVRAGYRSGLALGAAVLGAVVIVLVFKTFLQVKIPAGAIYERLPDGLRQIMLTYF